MENLSFEDAIEKLENIVNELENGKLTLDESMKKFEEGMTLSKYCNEIIDKAEKRINILVEKENGEVVEEPFDTEE